MNYEQLQACVKSDVVELPRNVEELNLRARRIKVVEWLGKSDEDLVWGALEGLFEVVWGVSVGTRPVSDYFTGGEIWKEGPGVLAVFRRVRTMRREWVNWVKARTGLTIIGKADAVSRYLDAEVMHQWGEAAALLRGDLQWSGVVFGVRVPEVFKVPKGVVMWGQEDEYDLREGLRVWEKFWGEFERVLAVIGVRQMAMVLDQRSRGVNAMVGMDGGAVGEVGTRLMGIAGLRWLRLRPGERIGFGDDWLRTRVGRLGVQIKARRAAGNSAEAIPTVGRHRVMVKRYGENEAAVALPEFPLGCASAYGDEVQRRLGEWVAVGERAFARLGGCGNVGAIGELEKEVVQYLSGVGGDFREGLVVRSGEKWAKELLASWSISDGALGRVMEAWVGSCWEAVGLGFANTYTLNSDGSGYKGVTSLLGNVRGFERVSDAAVMQLAVSQIAKGEQLRDPRFSQVSWHGVLGKRTFTEQYFPGVTEKYYGPWVENQELGDRNARALTSYVTDVGGAGGLGGICLEGMMRGYMRHAGFGIGKGLGDGEFWTGAITKGSRGMPGWRWQLVREVWLAAYLWSWVQWLGFGNGGRWLGIFAVLRERMRRILPVVGQMCCCGWGARQVIPRWGGKAVPRVVARDAAHAFYLNLELPALLLRDGIMASGKPLGVPGGRVGIAVDGKRYDYGFGDGELFGHGVVGGLRMGSLQLGGPWSCMEGEWRGVDEWTGSSVLGISNAGYLTALRMYSTLFAWGSSRASMVGFRGGLGNHLERVRVDAEALGLWSPAGVIGARQWRMLAEGMRRGTGMTGLFGTLWTQTGDNTSKMQPVLAALDGECMVGAVKQDVRVSGWDVAEFMRVWELVEASPLSVPTGVFEDETLAVGPIELLVRVMRAVIRGVDPIALRPLTEVGWLTGAEAELFTGYRKRIWGWYYGGKLPTSVGVEWQNSDPIATPSIWLQPEFMEMYQSFYELNGMPS